MKLPKLPQIKLPKFKKSLLDEVLALEEKSKDPNALMKTLGKKTRTSVEDLMIIPKDSENGKKGTADNAHLDADHAHTSHSTHETAATEPTNKTTDTFLEIMEEDPIFEGRIGLLNMLIIFLRNNRKQVAAGTDENDQLLNYLGIDPNNLKEMLLAIFGENPNYDEPHEIAMILDSKKRALEIVMQDLLGIKEDTSKAAMQAKLQKLAERTKNLKEILSNPLNPTLEEMAVKIAEGKYQLEADVLKKRAKELNLSKHIGTPKKFDETAIQELIAANKKTTPAHH